MDTERSPGAEEKAPASQPEVKPKEGGGALDTITKLVGAIALPLVVAVLGIGGSFFLAHRQDRETDLRLYTELMSKREEADTSLRQGMFNSIITNFLKPASEEQPDKRVLNLELLAYNFHDSLDLGPLFKDVSRDLSTHPNKNKPYIDRLVRVTTDVIAKQVAMLAEAGGTRDASIELAEVSDEKPAGVIVIDELITVSPAGDAPTKKQFRVEVLGKDIAKQELEVRLIVRTPPDIEVADATFKVGFFDFPMLDNVRLPHGLRCAIVLNAFDTEHADLTLVYFPASRASLKEKPYYDEILSTLRKP